MLPNTKRRNHEQGSNYLPDIRGILQMWMEGPTDTNEHGKGLPELQTQHSANVPTERGAIVIDKTIAITCDGRGCYEELSIDLDDGSPFEDDDTKIDKFLESKGWIHTYDGEFCQKCKAES